MKLKYVLATCACAALSIALPAFSAAAPADAQVEGTSIGHATQAGAAMSTASSVGEHGDTVDGGGVTQVPEPGTLVMLSLAVIGLVGISLYRRKRA